MALPAKTMQATVGAGRTPSNRTICRNKIKQLPQNVPQQQLRWELKAEKPEQVSMVHIPTEDVMSAPYGGQHHGSSSQDDASHCGRRPHSLQPHNLSKQKQTVASKCSTTTAAMGIESRETRTGLNAAHSHR